MRSNAVGKVRVKGEIIRLEESGEIRGFFREIMSLLEKKIQNSILNYLKNN